MRKGGVKLVLITGARLSTLLMRMAFLPAADAYVCENGGRIFYPDPSLTVALPISEDMDWRKTHNATGTVTHDAVKSQIQTWDCSSRSQSCITQSMSLSRTMQKFNGI